MNTTEQTMIHRVTFRNGNGVTVSDLINNEAVQVEFIHNAGTAEVTTKIFLSEEGARETGKLLVKHYNKEEEASKEMRFLDMKERCHRLEAENAKLIEENANLLKQKAPRKRK